MNKKKAVIIGAGPAGLTVAFELLARTDIVPLVIEMSDALGGISRTVNYKGNRIDIGGHRFFSKSDRVMEWWLQRMPLEKLDSNNPDVADRVMLVRRRKSRIYFARKFFEYPLRLNFDAVAKLGFIRTLKIGLSYVWATLFADRNPRNLEQFFIGRFGRELYRTFFKSYTEKVWGQSCTEISAEFGAQRVKGLSIRKAVAHFLKTLMHRNIADIRQKSTETSLIEEFLYPKLGPGQMWEIVAEEVTRRGGTILLNHRAARLHVDGNRIAAVDAVDLKTGRLTTYDADYVFSTMPVKELIESLDAEVPANVREVSDGLLYRDFVTVGLLVKELKIRESDRGESQPVTDNWIYVQEPDVKVGRMQIFNNWSPYLVADPKNTWVGLEYFCNETDDFWRLPDGEIVELAKTELIAMNMLDADAVLDATVIRVPKTYPAYFGTYGRFQEIHNFVDRFSNLYLIGRNGMHRYNNQDHSMLTAMTAVDNILSERADKANIWEVNAEQEYHENKSG